MKKADHVSALKPTLTVRNCILGGMGMPIQSLEVSGELILHGSGRNPSAAA